MKKWLAAAIVPIALAMTPISAEAQSMKRVYSQGELVNILKNEGYRNVEPVEDNAVRITIDGKKYIMIIQSDGDMQGYYGIIASGIDYQEINEWNKTKRLSRAYLDNDNDPVIEADLLANGGLTEEHITEFFDIFLLSVSAFRQYVDEND